MTKMIHNYTAANSIDAAADYLLIDPASSGIYKSINRNTLLGLSSAPLGTTDIQSPQNKTFDNTNTYTTKDGSLTIQNSASPTKQAVFSASGITAGQTRTFTFPDASTTLVGTGTTQTLTSKTLTSPTITGGTIDNSTITVDSISGHTSATIVTVANLQISNGVLNTNNSVVASNITNGAVQPQALVSGTGSGWAWTSWTPSWSNLTVGNGTVSAKYIQIGKAVLAEIQFILGSTSSVGTGPTFTLPVTSTSNFSNGQYIGGVRMVAAGTGYIGAIYWNSTTTAQFLAIGASGNYITENTITASVPGTWTTSNSLAGTLFYEAA